MAMPWAAQRMDELTKQLINTRDINAAGDIQNAMGFVGMQGARDILANVNAPIAIGQSGYEAQQKYGWQIRYGSD